MTNKRRRHFYNAAAGITRILLVMLLSLAIAIPAGATSMYGYATDEAQEASAEQTQPVDTQSSGTQAPSQPDPQPSQQVTAPDITPGSSGGQTGAAGDNNDDSNGAGQDNGGSGGNADNSIGGGAGDGSEADASGDPQEGGQDIVKQEADASGTNDAGFVMNAISSGIEEETPDKAEDTAKQRSRSVSRIWLDPSRGSDDNDGESSGSALKSFERVAELLKLNMDIVEVIAMSAIKGEGEMSLPDGVVLKRNEGFTGSMIVVDRDKSLTLRNITIDGKEGSDRADSMIRVNGTLVMEEGTTLQNNVNTDNWYKEGGGVYVASGGNFVMNGGRIVGCQSGFGGGVGVFGIFEMNGGEISGNTAAHKSGKREDSSGGGVGIGNNGIMYMNGGEISGNTATYFGGGISLGDYYVRYVDNAYPKLYMNGGRIAGNTSGNCGGGIFVQANGYARVSRGIIEGNRSRSGLYGGGAVYVNGGYQSIGYRNGLLELTDVEISGNHSGYYGGALAACPTSNSRIYMKDGSVIYGNYDYRGNADEIYAEYRFGRGMLTIGDRLLNGTPYHWLNSNGDEVSYDALTNSSGLRLHNDLTSDDENVRDSQQYVKVRITGNSSALNGGGIGSNGDVIIGQTPGEKVSVRASKIWEDDSNGADFGSIKVWLVRDVNGHKERLTYQQLRRNSDGTWTDVVFTGLPARDPITDELIEYSVEEEMPDGSENYRSIVSMIGGADGVIDFEIINSTMRRDLTIVKNVERNADGSDNYLTDEEFEFIIRLLDEEGADVEGEFETVDQDGKADIIIFKDGTAVIVLKAGHRLTIKNLKTGYTYTVTEKEGRYTTKVNGIDGNTFEGVIEDDSVVLFTNTPLPPTDDGTEVKTETPEPPMETSVLGAYEDDRSKGDVRTAVLSKGVDTGDSNALIYLIVISLLAAAGIAAILAGRRP